MKNHQFNTDLSRINKIMCCSNKMFMFYVIICVCVITCNGDAIKQTISRKKCQEYGNLIKSTPCIESSGTRGSAKAGDYPHMALLGYNHSHDNKIIWSCAGVLISDQYVLTAAHCLNHQNPSVVRFGELNIKSDEDNTNIQDVKTSEIIRHPKYIAELLYNDIALIKLEKPVQINQYVRLACLPDANEIIDVANQKFIKSGWGLLPKENVEQKPYLLYNKNIVGVSYETCKNSYPKFARFENGLEENTQLCIGSHEEECQIISGSPVQIKDKDVGCMHKIFGLVSFAYRKCENNTPEVSTKVPAYVDWIEKTIWA